MPRALPPDTIFSVVHDNHNMLCLTEDQLDEWFRSLPADRKAALYEAELEGVLDEPIYDPTRQASPAARSLEEHAARFMRAVNRTMTAPLDGLREQARRA